jgi:hypothetical protein
MLYIAAIITGSMAGIGFLIYLFINTPAARIKRILLWVTGITIVSIVIILLYRLSGSFLWSWMVFLIPLILRWKNIIQRFRNAAKTVSGPSGGQVSSVNTEFLEMKLYHDSGKMSGLVKKGQKKGQRIETLGLNELFELLEEAKSDPLSIQLLEKFLDTKFNDSWKDQHHRRTDEQGTNNGTDTFNRSNALEVLGLTDPVTDKQIRDAHRRLILANHPDKGGSTFLAAQINKAKEVLLGNNG